MNKISYLYKLKNVAGKAIIISAVLIFCSGVNGFSASKKSETIRTKNSDDDEDTSVLKVGYTVRMEGQGIGCALFVNGIPAMDNDYPGVSNRMINPLLIIGKNTFKLLTLPVDAETKKQEDWLESDKFCKVSISSFQNKGKFENKLVTESEVKLTKPDGVDSMNGSFAVTLVYPTPLWTNSAKIGKDAATQQKILAKYKEFYNLLLKKDINGISKLSTVKFKQYANSMYNPNYGAEIIESLKEQLASKDQLIGIDVQAKNGLKYEYYYGDRLVSIKNNEDRSIIQYYDNVYGVTTQYPLFFYFDGVDFVLVL